MVSSEWQNAQNASVEAHRQALGQVSQVGNRRKSRACRVPHRAAYVLPMSRYADSWHASSVRVFRLPRWRACVRVWGGGGGVFRLF